MPSIGLLGLGLGFINQIKSNLQGFLKTINSLIKSNQNQSLTFNYH